MSERATFEYLTAQVSPAAGASGHETAADEDGLHVCVACGSKLVYPTHWEPYQAVSCRVALHCPDCDLVRVGVFERSRVDNLERELERGEAELEADLARIENANMAGYVDLFVAALEADAIQPLDF
jgi:hypothetical protein